MEPTRLTDVVDLAVAKIDERLASLKQEKAELKAAKKALSNFRG